MINITPIGIEKVIQSLQKLKENTGKLTPVMREIGNLIKNETELSFEAEKSPYGAKWKPSVRALATGGKTLVKSGRLANSITYTANNNSVRVGTNLVYAPIHQFGGNAGRGRRAKIPARPYMPINSNSQMPDYIISDVIELLEKNIL